LTERSGAANAMISKIKLIHNPKIFLIFIIILALPAAGVLFIYIFNVVMGVIAIGIALYLNYHLIKFVIGHLTSRIETSESRILCRTSTNEVIEMAWESITIAGCFKEPKSEEKIFVYHEGLDKLLKISRDYSDFDQLMQEIRAKTPFQEIQLAENETLEQRLKRLI
jgi:hypothetical protein